MKPGSSRNANRHSSWLRLGAVKHGLKVYGGVRLDADHLPLFHV
ncbi:hypothetical protein ABIB90_007805 [Bradyrhizobium sp. JR4.1]